MTHSLAGETPVVICVAPNGARRSQRDHRKIPLTAAELAADALACVEAGATVMHLHVRTATGEHSLDPNHYRTALGAIRSVVGERLLLQVTTEAAGKYAPHEQMAVVRELKPECISVAIREFVPDSDSEGAAAEFFRFTAQHHIGVQYILYSRADVARFLELRERKVVTEPEPHGLFVLGSYRDPTPSDPRSLLAFIDLWPVAWPWAVCAFGVSEARCLAAAVALGGHVRVGFENNLHRPDGAPADSNAQLIQNICGIIDGTGRARASVSHARSVYPPRARPQHD